MCGNAGISYQIGASGAGSLNGTAPSITIPASGGGQSHDHTLSANFSGSANSVLSPYLVLIYIIKT